MKAINEGSTKMTLVPSVVALLMSSRISPRHSHRVAKAVMFGSYFFICVFCGSGHAWLATSDI
jgi:hypothetical protein